MNWQWLWLGFLLPMTVSSRALGPAGKETAVVSPPGEGGTQAQEGTGVLHYSPIQASLLTFSLSFPSFLCSMIYSSRAPSLRCLSFILP